MIFVCLADWLASQLTVHLLWQNVDIEYCLLKKVCIHQVNFNTLLFVCQSKIHFRKSCRMTNID